MSSRNRGTSWPGSAPRQEQHHRPDRARRDGGPARRARSGPQQHHRASTTRRRAPTVGRQHRPHAQVAPGAPWRRPSKTEGDDLSGLDHPAFHGAHETDAAQGARQSGAGDAVANGAGCTARVEELGWVSTFAMQVRASSKTGEPVAVMLSRHVPPRTRDRAHPRGARPGVTARRGQDYTLCVTAAPAPSCRPDRDQPRATAVPMFPEAGVLGFMGSGCRH